MDKIGKINNFSPQYKPGGRLMMLLLILLAICIFSGAANADTSIYVFDPNQSTVIQTGGFAGVNETYGIKGRFQLTVDFEAGIASFDIVDANLAEPSGFLHTQSLGMLFNMTGLVGTIIDDTTIEFEGKTTDSTESDVSIKLILNDGTVSLTGKITPPPNSADMFTYELNAVAVRKYSDGTGEPNNPYQIATAEGLIALGETPEDYEKHFILTADIDLDPNLPGRKIFNKAIIAPDTNNLERGFQGISFSGIFEGNGHKISHLTIIGDSYLGLFGQLDNGATILNLGLEAVDINGTVDYIGGLVGFNNNGNISKSYSTGVVSGNWHVGGLVGHNEDGSIITSYSTAKVTGTGVAGGLVGRIFEGSITASYTTGTVTGTEYEYVGGLVGFNRDGSINESYSNGTVTGIRSVGDLVGCNADGSITASYSAARVIGIQYVGGLVGYNNGRIITSFWDIETSEQGVSDGGTGKTTTEMQIASTFLEAGWDFVGEKENGTEDIWSICEGTNYPRFVWQIPAGDFVCPDGVTIEDFAFFMEHWLDDNCDSSNGYCDGTDLDQSGTVDVNDLEIFFENWPGEN